MASWSRVRFETFALTYLLKGFAANVDMKLHRGLRDRLGAQSITPWPDLRAAS